MYLQVISRHFKNTVGIKQKQKTLSHFCVSKVYSADYYGSF